MNGVSANRALAALLVGALLGFVTLTGLAALAYPGGTYCEPAARSYRFWGNFFCDLTAGVTLRGEDNARGAALSQAAFVSFAFATGPFFWLLGGLAERARRVRVPGLVAAVATIVLAWLPSHESPSLHAVAVFSATLPGLLAAALGVGGLLRAEAPPDTPRVAGVLGLVTLAAGVADAAGYAYALETRAGCLPWLPALQKLVALSLVAWMLAVAAAGARRA